MFSFWGVMRDEEDEVDEKEKGKDLDDQEEDDEYVTEIRRQRRLLKARNENLQGQLRQVELMLSERPPVWVADEDRSCCFACESAFSLFNRRHHCRACGEIFDAKCITRSKQLPAYPRAGPQKVCDGCFEGSDNLLKLIDLNSSALVALGLGGVDVEDPSMLESPKRVPRPRPILSAAIPIMVNEPVAILTAEKEPVAGKRRRSEIPPAPPFPTVMPKLSAPIVSFALPAKSTAKKEKPKLNVPVNAKRIDFEELQNGIARLKKAPRTPLKAKTQEKSAISELRKSLRRRRRCLEDSIILSPAASPEAEVNDMLDENVAPPSSIKSSKSTGNPLFDSFRESLALKEIMIPNVNTNSSWLGDD